MYRKRKANNGNTKNTASNGNKRELNTINENSTIKITRTKNNSTQKDVAEIEEMLSSEENIPASQEPTQRYLSQRSTIAATLGRTQSRVNSSQKPPNSYYELALMKSGLLSSVTKNFVLECDHITFVNKLRLLLHKNQNFQENLKMFITGLREAWPKCAVKLLSGCTINILNDESPYPSHNSMIVNFFMIEFLRDKVLELLLEQIRKCACEKTVNIIENDISILPLMLSQLQYVVGTHSEIIYQHIKEIFENALEQHKRDIISNAELILHPSKHDDFAKLLIDSEPNSQMLFKTYTIQTLTNLGLSSQLQGRLHVKVLAYMKEHQCPKTIIPLLIKFLLKILSEDNEDSIRQLINTLREILHWLEQNETVALAKDKELQLELFGYIEQGLTRSKKFYSLWQKTIASLDSTKFKTIDFIIVLVLWHIRDDNSRYLQNVLRRHIKLLPTSIVQEIRNNYGSILEQHWYILMQIINLFLRDKHKVVVDFARTCFGTFFEISESVQRSILKKLLELTCEKSNKNVPIFALNMLGDLWQLYPKILHNWGLLLLPFLDQLHAMSLSQTRIVMELLSSIAFPGLTLEECTLLQDQIDMVVKKQIINRDIFVRKQGIIGAVQLIDCIARIGEHVIEADDFETTFNTISDIPEGRGRIAAKYIERIQSSIFHSPELLALFYDELANVCSVVGADRANGFQLDSPFVIWICELMTFCFQNSFVAEHCPGKVDGIQLVHMKCINTIADTNTEEEHQSELPQITINIGELVLRPPNEANSSIIILSPLFNLVRVLHMLRYEGSLEIINALLGCSITLPSFFDDDNVDAIFMDYDKEMQVKLLDIYFHCVNWIRETVSSFATQQEKMIRQKVLQRLADLINIEAKIKQLLLKAPLDYIPPQSEFITGQSPMTAKSGTKVRTIGVKNSNETKAIQNNTEISHMNETNLHDITRGNDLTTKLAGANKLKLCKKSYFENSYGPKEIFRQMDTNIVLVLKERLEIKYPLPTELVGSCMGLLEFRFILTDIVSKLESVVGIQKFQTEQPRQYIAKPGHLLCDLSDFIGTIAENMKNISAAINSKLDEVQNIHSHADLFAEEFNLLKVCFGLCLRLLVAFFSWSEWLISEYRIKKLKESLLVLLDKAKYKDLKNKPVPILAAGVFDVLIKYEASITDLKSAVCLYQLMIILNVLSDKSSKTKQSQEIRSLCRTLLCRKWFNYEGLMEKGAQCNVYLDELIKGFLCDSDFKRQREILLIVREEAKLLHSKDSSLKSFPNFKKANFPLFFRGLCEVLITSLNTKLTVNALESIDDKLEFWESSTNTLNMLLEIVQILDVPRNFQIFLKHSHLFLKLVLQHGLNVFEKYLKQNTVRICELIKTMQTTTRFLHRLCCQSKAIKNTAIISQIPVLRETVENYLFRIKALLSANDCGSFFSMGNLKNKDLHGDDLVSQASAFSAATEQESDEEIPDDDVSIDETIMGNDDTEDQTNCTENRSKSSSRSKCF